MSPPRVLPRQPPDQHGPPPGPAGVLPRSGRSTSARPGAGARQQGARRHDPAAAAGAWAAAAPGRRSPPGQPSPASGGRLAAQDRDLVPQHQDLGILRRRRARPATPSTRSGGRRPGRASVPSQARDSASRGPLAQPYAQASIPMPRFGTPQGVQVRDLRGFGQGRTALLGQPAGAHGRRRLEPAARPVRPRARSGGRAARAGQRRAGTRSGRAANPATAAGLRRDRARRHAAGRPGRPA